MDDASKVTDAQRIAFLEGKCKGLEAQVKGRRAEIKAAREEVLKLAIDAVIWISEKMRISKAYKEEFGDE